MDQEDATSLAQYYAIQEIQEEMNIITCCRACMLTNCALISIDTADKDSILYYEKLTRCISDIEWYKEGLSSLICKQCILNLRIAYEFRKTCLSSDEAFKKYLLLQNDTLLKEKANKYTDGSDPEDPNQKYLYKRCTVEQIKDDEDNCINQLEETADELVEEVLESDSDSTNASFKQENIDSSVDEVICNDSKNNLLNDNALCEQERRFITSDTINILVDCNTNLPTEYTSIQKYGNAKTKYYNFIQTPNSKPSNIESQKHKNYKIFKKEHDTVENKDNIKLKLLNHSLPINFKKQVAISLIPDPTEVSNDEMVLSDKPQNFEKSSNGTETFYENNNVTKSVKKHECKICNKSYKKKANLTIHQRTHTGEKPFECQYCEKSFYTSSHRKEHERRHTGEKPYMCTICKKRFTIRGELTMHFRKHTGERKHQCKFCNKGCRTSSDLINHVRTHTGEKPFSCSTCGRNFGNTHNLTMHMKLHTGDRPHSCNVCGKAFTQTSHLRVHMSTHTGEKFACKHCPELFKHTSQLYIHVKKCHNAEALPYKCSICEKSFLYPKQFEIHMKKHNGEHYTCDVCKKQFCTPRYLKEHSRIHSGIKLYPCPVPTCRKQFTRKQYLEKHNRSHTGEKPYVCEQCGKRFVQSSSLNVHKHLHTGEKPHACTFCLKRFITRSDLNSHQRVHTKASTFVKIENLNDLDAL